MAITAAPTGLPVADRQDHGRSFVTWRLFDAPRPLVWAAWTEPARLAQWWGPNGARTTVERFDLREGGEVRLLIRCPDGITHACCGVFREITPPERLVLAGPADAPDACGAGLPPRSVVTVTFEEVGARTRLTVHTRFDTAAAHEAAVATGFSTGWTEGLERLGAQFARDRGRQ